jgi:urease accessory protein
VHGLACAALGVESRSALLAYGYALAANQTAASLKLMSIGQMQAQAVLGAAGERITAAVEEALARTMDDFGGFTPGLDIRSMQHEYLFRRLFIS